MSLEDMFNIACDVYNIALTPDSVGGNEEVESLKQADAPCRIVEKTATEREVYGRRGVVSTHTLYTSFLNIIPSDIIKIIKHTITANTISFADTNPDTILDSADGFVAAGFEAGAIVVSGSANNNGNLTVESEGVAAGTITLTSSNTLTVEAAGNTVIIKQHELYDIVDGDDWARAGLYLKIDVVKRV